MGFFEGLEQNIRAASNAALIKSVVCDSEQTIGDIITALEAEPDATYLLEAFRELTVGQIVNAALVEIHGLGKEELEREEEEEDEEEEEVEPPPKKVKTKPASTTKKAPPRKGTKSKPDWLDLSTPEARKAYEASIIKTLKGGKHVDEESGITSQELRGTVGGEAAQAREFLDKLIEDGRVAFYGKARGMRYYLFA